MFKFLILNHAFQKNSMNYQIETSKDNQAGILTDRNRKSLTEEKNGLEICNSKT